MSFQRPANTNADDTEFSEFLTFTPAPAIHVFELIDHGASRATQDRVVGWVWCRTEPGEIGFKGDVTYTLPGSDFMIDKPDGAVFGAHIFTY